MLVGRGRNVACHNGCGGSWATLLPFDGSVCNRQSSLTVSSKGCGVNFVDSCRRSQLAWINGEIKNPATTCVTAPSLRRLMQRIFPHISRLSLVSSIHASSAAFVNSPGLMRLLVKLAKCQLLEADPPEHVADCLSIHSGLAPE